MTILLKILLPIYFALFFGLALLILPKAATLVVTVPGDVLIHLQVRLLDLIYA